MLLYDSRGSQIFHESSSQKDYIKLHTENPQMLGTTAQNSVT